MEVCSSGYEIGPQSVLREIPMFQSVPKSWPVKRQWEMSLYLRRYSSLNNGRKHNSFIQSVHVQRNTGLIHNNSVIDGNWF
jgi:hypothetical protein